MAFILWLKLLYEQQKQKERVGEKVRMIEKLVYQSGTQGEKKH